MERKRTEKARWEACFHLLEESQAEMFYNEQRVYPGRVLPLVGALSVQQTVAGFPWLV